MAIFISNTTQSLAAALKDVQRLEAPESKKKEKDTPAQSVAKAVTVSISSDAKMHILKRVSWMIRNGVGLEENRVDQLAYLTK